MIILHLLQKMNRKEDVSFYQNKDANLEKTMTTKDFLALGIGTIVSTAIFTLPGIVAADHAGPAVSISFVLAALVAGLVAFNYSEMASTLPFAGSAYSWINIVFGEFWGWIVGWALLAEYFICVSFVASGISANFRGLISPLGFNLPKSLSNTFGSNGGIFDLTAVIAMLLVAVLLYHGNNNMTKVEKTLVVLKVLAILVFLGVGLFAIHKVNYSPFIPKFHTNSDGSSFGGWSGIYAGISMIFLSYIGFDSIAANSAEAKNPKKTMPKGIIGSLIVAAVLFVAVSLVLVGMFKYTNYANNAEPVGWALRSAGHTGVATVVQAVAVLGMFTGLIAMMLAGSRLLYSFGRDGMLPKWLGHLNQDTHLPNHALLTITIIGILMGAIFPFGFLSQLISAGTLIAFMFVSIAMYSLRRKEGKELPKPEFKVPFYPVLPALGFLCTLFIFLELSQDAKIYSIVWFLIGVIIYFAYGIHHSHQNKSKNK